MRREKAIATFPLASVLFLARNVGISAPREGDCDEQMHVAVEVEHPRLVGSVCREKAIATT